MAESAFQLTTRQGIERDITDSHNKHDSDQVNEKLDLWPYGRERPEVSLEVARYAVKRLSADQPTEEIPIVRVA